MYLFPRRAFALLFAFAVCLWAESVRQAHLSKWKTQQGWALRKAPGASRYEKFFAVGVWNIPGYTKEAMENAPQAYRSGAAAYLQHSPLYNMVYLSPGADDAAAGRVEVTGSIAFYECLKACQQAVPSAGGTDADYAVRQQLRLQAQEGEASFLQRLDDAIDRNIRAIGTNDHIWAPVDEIAGGGAGSGWCWSPEVGRRIRQRIRRREPHTLVYTDLLGISRGSSYLFERRYLQSHAALPSEPPYDALGEGARRLPQRPLLGFVQAYDGSPVYVNGTADYVSYDLPTLKRFFYENLRICARDYRACGDVFGINSFIDCNTYPVLAGVAVDGIRSGVGPDVPVWIFFDGNGYARPAHQSPEAFAGNLKCQMYISIIHGATGILFWNDRSLSPEVFQALEPVLTELKDREPIIKAGTLEQHLEGDVHYMVKRLSDGRTYFVAANTLTDKEATCSYNGQVHRLPPYGVAWVQL